MQHFNRSKRKSKTMTPFVEPHDHDEADTYWRDKVPDCWALVASMLVTAAVLGTSLITAVVA